MYPDINYDSEFSLSPLQWRAYFNKPLPAQHPLWKSIERGIKDIAFRYSMDGKSNFAKVIHKHIVEMWADVYERENEIPVWMALRWLQFLNHLKAGHYVLPIHC